MPDKTHFSEEDVAAIFQDAIRAQEAARSRVGRHDGLTLDELKEIGGELGITPEFIERAAAARKATISASPDQKMLGIPVSVERILPLPRSLTDNEWGLLVADVRDTFKARGTVSTEGSLRQWANGNLTACVEPTRTGGYQLRLRTMKGNAATGLSLAAMFAVFGVLLTTLLVLKDLPQDPSKYALGAFFGLVALGALLTTAITVPRWHRERSRQMDEIAGRVSAMVYGQSDEAPTDPVLAEGQEGSAADLVPLLNLDVDDATNTTENVRSRRDRT